MCPVAECEGDALAKVYNMWEAFTLVLLLSQSCKTFIFWLNDSILFAVLFLKLLFSKNSIWLPEFKPGSKEPGSKWLSVCLQTKWSWVRVLLESGSKVLSFSSSSCASITFTLAFTLTSSFSSFFSCAANFCIFRYFLEDASASNSASLIFSLTCSLIDFPDFLDLELELELDDLVFLELLDLLDMASTFSCK